MATVTVVDYENIESPQFYERPKSEAEAHCYSDLEAQNRRPNAPVMSKSRQLAAENTTRNTQADVEETFKYRRLKDDRGRAGERPKPDNRQLRTGVGVLLAIIVFVGMVTVSRVIYYHLFIQDNTSIESADQYTDCAILGYQYIGNATFCVRSYISGNGSNWFQANKRCRDDGGQLISIATNKKWNAVKDTTGSRQDCWIGLNSRKWLSSEKFTTNVTTLRFQLNNQFPNRTSSCGVLNSSTIVENNCSRRLSCFICQIDI